MDTNKIDAIIGTISAIKLRAELINTKISQLKQEEQLLETEFSQLLTSKDEWKSFSEEPKIGDIVLAVSIGNEKEFEYAVFPYNGNKKDLLDIWMKIQIPSTVSK